MLSNGTFTSVFSKKKMVCKKEESSSVGLMKSVTPSYHLPILRTDVLVKMYTDDLRIGLLL